MSVWKRILLLCAVALLSLAVVGCGGGDKKGKKAERAPKGKATVEAPAVPMYEKADAIDVDVYLDGTYSMRGYVNTAGSTVYLDALKNIERTISGNWKKDTIQYHKFGDSIQKISREEFLNTNREGFYDQTDTSLQRVIESTKEGKLNIIVTDFFQTNQDIDSLLHVLKNKYFADPANAVALIGLKSQFNGTIYDVGKDRTSFKYESKSNEIETYRPFYLLLLGKDSDVREFSLAFEKVYKDGQGAKMAFFGKNIGVKNELTKGKKVFEKRDKVANMARSDCGLKDDSILQLRMKEDKEYSGVIADFKSHKILGSSGTEYKVELQKLERWQGGSFSEVKAKDFLEKSSVTNFAVMEGEAKATLKFVTKAKELNKQEGIYRVHFALSPKKDAYYDGVNSFKEWNFTADEIGSKPQAVGGKTLNITSFVENLAQTNYKMNDPGFYDLYVYLEVK